MNATTDRTSLVLEHLAATAGPWGFQLHTDNDPTWTEAHPGGFGAAVLAREGIGEAFRVNPGRLAELTDHLDEHEVREILDAVLAWWKWSAVRVAVRMPAHEAAILFRGFDSDSAQLLSSLAVRAKAPYDRFVTY